MFDKNTPSAKRALAEYDKRRVRQCLLKIAAWSTQSEAEALDLVQDAMLRVLDEQDRPWLRGKFLMHMTFVIRDTWKEKLRRKSATELPDEGVTAGERSVAPTTPADVLLHRKRRLETWRILGERLLARIRGKHPMAERVFELACEGVEDPAEMAVVLDCPVEDVYEAMRVLKRNGKQIKDEWELSEEKRMADLRAADQKRQDALKDAGPDRETESER